MRLDGRIAALEKRQPAAVGEPWTWRELRQLSGDLWQDDAGNVGTLAELEAAAPAHSIIVRLASGDDCQR